MKMDMTSTVQGKPEKMSINATGKFRRPIRQHQTDFNSEEVRRAQLRGLNAGAGRPPKMAVPTRTMSYQRMAASQAMAHAHRQRVEPKAPRRLGHQMSFTPFK